MSINKAKKILNDTNSTCVAIKNNIIYQSNLNGIMPIISKLKEILHFLKEPMWLI